MMVSVLSYLALLGNRFGRLGLLSTLALSALIVAAVPTVPVTAQDLAAPRGRVILVVSGNITHSNGDGKASFDRAMLEALASATIRTDTPWTQGSAEFHGPLGRALLQAVGAGGDNLKAVALNDYAVDIPVGDFVDYDVILALAKDGDRLRVRDRGPLWVIYPWSDHPELQDDTHYSRSIWQLREIIVE